MECCVSDFWLIEKSVDVHRILPQSFLFGTILPMPLGLSDVAAVSLGFVFFQCFLVYPRFR